MEFRDLNQQYKKYELEIDQAIKSVLNKGIFIGGKEVSSLEKRLSNYIGVKHCITCANGTDALSLVLTAWGIGQGDAVFVPDFTFFATAEVVASCGATPIFIDVDKDTFNIDSRNLEKQITQIIKEKKLVPRVIIPVDLFGLPADHHLISAIAKKYDLLVLDDFAQGFGGSINGKMVGSFGNAATTSFFPAKPLGCYGDGGAIFTDDDELAEVIKSLKVHGKGDNKYDNVRIGVNSRLDTIQAAILNIKLSAFIEHELEEVNSVYKMYTNKLKDFVRVPLVPENYQSSFAQYTITMESKEERDSLQKELKDNGIPSMIYYPKPLHKQVAFNGFMFDEKELKTASELCDLVLSLPMHPYLCEEDVNKVSDVIIGFLRKHK